MGVGMIKVSKNITLTYDNVQVIQQLMARTHKNFSQTVNILIQNWVTINHLYEKQQAESDEKSKEAQLWKERALSRQQAIDDALQNYKKAQPIKE